MRFFQVVGFLIGVGPFSCAADSATSCPGGWFGVQAMITRITPAESIVTRLAKDRSTTKVQVDSVLCAGDSLLVGDSQDGTVVELYQAGEIVTVPKSRDVYMIKGGVAGRLGAAAAYVNEVLSAAEHLPAPRARPGPTGVRGQSGSQDDVRQIRPIQQLRDLPRQRLLPDTTVIVAWRDGAGPYVCEARAETGEIHVMREERGAAWCELRIDPSRTARVLVRDGRGRSTGWNTAPAIPSDLPRPPWAPADPTSASSAEQTAWAIWIWQHGGPSWRLQSLSMLNANAREEFVAGYFLDSVLAEIPPFPPQ